MGLEEIVPAIALIAVLILILPNFLRSNSEKKQFFKNLSVWIIIVLLVMIILLYLRWKLLGLFIIYQGLVEQLFQKV